MSLSRFMRVYSSIPIAERNNICCVVDGQPISWNLAYSEISSGTSLGFRIQRKLEELGII